MGLILRNISGVLYPINDIGITLQVGEDYDLLQEDPIVVSSSSIDGDCFTAISNGFVQVLDPLDDSTPLIISAALDALREHNSSNYRLGKGARILDAADTLITAPILNEQLQYNGTQWINVPASAPPPPGAESSVQLFWGPIVALTGTTVIPKDTSLPLITEGSEVFTQVITPTETTSSIRIATNVTFSSSNASIELVFAVFRDSVCVGTAVNTTANKSSGFAVSFEIYDEPGQDTEIVYSCRVGKNGGGGTWYINEIHGTIGAFAGTLQNNSYSIEEIGTT